jgi:hypothetical protein
MLKVPFTHEWSLNFQFQLSTLRFFSVPTDKKVKDWGQLVVENCLRPQTDIKFLPCFGVWKPISENFPSILDTPCMYILIINRSLRALLLQRVEYYTILAPLRSLRLSASIFDCTLLSYLVSLLDFCTTYFCCLIHNFKLEYLNIARHI